MGVKDNGEIIGVNPNCVKDMRKNFSNTLSNPQKISPTLYLTAEEYEIDGRIILYVYVPKSSQVHTCSKITYDRVDDADVDISRSTSQMSELYMRKQTEYTEKKQLPYLTADYLNMQLLDRVRNLARSKDPNHPWIGMSDMDILKSAGLYERDFSSGKEGFNLAAVLLFGKDETIRSCLPAYKTDAIYRVENVDRYDDREDIRTNLIDSYDRLVGFISRHTDDRFYLDGTQRISVRSIIARELISNILMHREYSSPFPAKVIIEKDRILTENANKTYHYGPIRAESFTPYPKNPIIANFFNNIGRADELGSGVRNLFKYTKIYSESVPMLFEDDVFRAEIPLFEFTTAETADSPPKTADKSAETADKSAETADKSAETADKSAETADKPPKTADKPPKTADKSPKKSDLKPKTEHKTYEEAIIGFIKDNGSICNADARELLALKSSRVKDIFKAMVGKGLLKPEGERRNRRYLLP